MFKLLLIGPVCKDIIIHNNKIKYSTGGAVYYQAQILESFKQNYECIVTLSEYDIELLNSFPDKNKINILLKTKTLNFINKYADDNPNYRIQKSNMINNPINPQDIQPFIENKKFEYVLLGPLLKTDLPIESIKFLKNNGLKICMGIQGYLRRLKKNKVILESPPYIDELLKLIDILFLDEDELKTILKYKKVTHEMHVSTLSRMGPSEIIITQSNKGSKIYSKKHNKIYNIPPIPVKNVVNPTGSGDTYMAAFICERLKNNNLLECGLFASMTCAEKIENEKNFNKTKDYIKKRINKIEPYLF